MVKLGQANIRKIPMLGSHKPYWKQISAFYHIKQRSALIFYLRLTKTEEMKKYNQF